jgi:hypothetical protein
LSQVEKVIYTPDFRQSIFSVIALVLIILQAVPLEVDKFVILIAKLSDNLMMLETLLSLSLELFHPAL